jgi:hypothetical protein
MTLDPPALKAEGGSPLDRRRLSGGCRRGKNTMMDENRAGSGEGYASVDGVGQNLGYFHVWLTKSGEVGGAFAADGRGRSCAAAQLRRRRLLVAGAAASLAGMACASLMSVSPGGATARLPGGWGRAVELQGLGSASPRPSNQGGCPHALLPCSTT